MEFKIERVKKGYLIDSKPRLCSSRKKLFYYIKGKSSQIFRENDKVIIIIRGFKDGKETTQ